MESEKPFDPYYEWLAIPPDEQPPDAYRLLGVRRFESNQNVISNALDQRMSHIRSFQVGKRGAVSQKLLTQLSQAGGILLDEAKRAEYDNRLKAKLAAAQKAASKPLTKAAPVQPVARPVVPVVQQPPAAVLPTATPTPPPPHYAQQASYPQQPAYAQQQYPQQPNYAQQPYPQQQPYVQQPVPVYQQPPPVYVEPTPALPTIQTETTAKSSGLMSYAIGGVLVLALAVGGILYFRGNMLGTSPQPAPVAETPGGETVEKTGEITIVPVGYDLNTPAELPADLPVLKVVDKTPPQSPVAMPTLPTQFTADEKIAFVTEDQSVCFHRLKGLALLETRSNGKEIVWQFSRQYAGHADFISANAPPRALRLFTDRYLVYDLQDRAWAGRGSKGSWVASDALPQFVDAARTRVSTQLASLANKPPVEVASTNPPEEPTETKPPAKTEPTTTVKSPPTTTNPTTGPDQPTKTVTIGTPRSQNLTFTKEGRQIRAITSYIFSYNGGSSAASQRRTVEISVRPELIDPAPFQERYESIAAIPAGDRVLRVLVKQTGNGCQLVVLDGYTRLFDEVTLRTDRLQTVGISYDLQSAVPKINLMLDGVMKERLTPSIGTNQVNERLIIGSAHQCPAMSGVFGRLRISDTFQETGSAELIPAPDDLAFFDFATNQYGAVTSVQGKHTLEYVHLFQPRNNVGRDLALQINGTNQVHFVDSKELLDWNAPHTIEMLFKWGAREQLGTLFSVGNFSLRTEVVEGNQTLLARFQRESAQIPQSALLSRLPFNEYVHFAAQYDGTKMYVSINGKRLLGIDALEESSIPCDLMLGGELPRDSLSAAFLLKGFRISNTALYPPGQFTPPNKLEPEGQATALCLDFNSGSPTEVVDLSSERRRAKLPLPWWMNSTDFIALSSPKTQTNPNTTTPPSVSSTSKFKNPAPPSEKELADARIELDRRYGAQLREAKRPDEKIRVATELKAVTTPNSISPPAWRWVVETSVRDLYATAGRVKEAFAVHDRLANSFDHDFWPEEVATCLKLGDASLLADAKEELGVIALTKSQNAIGRDQFEDAHKLLVLASRMLLSTKSTDVKQNLTAWRAQLTLIKKKQDEVIAALATLKSNPDDPAANREVGSYYSFILEEWERGRPFLQKSEDPTLTRLATVDAEAKTAVLHKAAGDAWWDYLEDQKSISREERQIIQRHIRFHYGHIRANYKIAKTSDGTVEKRMASFAALPPRVEFDLGKKQSRRPQEAMTGMIGRVAVNSVPTQIYVHLRPGNVAAPTDLDALNRRLNPTGSGVIQIEFAGVLKMPQDENCRIIFSGQHSRVVLIDNQQISTSSAIPLAAGDHQVLARFAGPAVDNVWFDVSSRQNGNRFLDFTVPPEVLKRIGYDDSKELLKWGW